MIQFYKITPASEIWLVDKDDSFGKWLFSFDKKTILNFWQDYPEKLTNKQVEMFKKEFPIMAKLKEK